MAHCRSVSIVFTLAVVATLLEETRSSTIRPIKRQTEHLQKYEQQFGYKETSEAPRRVVYTLGDSETPRRVVYTPGDSEAPRRVVYMVGDSEAPRRVVYTAGGSGYYPASAKGRNRGEGGEYPVATEEGGKIPGGVPVDDEVEVLNVPPSNQGGYPSRRPPDVGYPVLYPNGLYPWVYPYSRCCAIYPCGWCHVIYPYGQYLGV